MKYIFIYPLLFCCLSYNAQQTIMYTQYTFNKAGMNPAASGTDINRKYNYVMGLNRQWLQFDNAPKTSFVNFSYTIKPPRSYRYWQNAGIYIDADQSGLIENIGLYATYAIHILVRKKSVMSIGVFLGARRYSRSVGTLDPNDPAVIRSKTSLYLYPDLIPGFRLSNKKYFMDLAVRQLTITKLQDFNGNKIGGPSKLKPVLFASYGRYIPLTEQFLMMPSIAVNIPFISPPIADANLMFYLWNRVGVGASLRNLSFVSGIFQIRFLENITAGFAYSYPVNSTSYGAGDSYEIMIGIVPMGMVEKSSGRHSVARCPSLNY